MGARKRGSKWWFDFMYNGTRYRQPSPDNTRAGALSYEALIRQKLARGLSLEEKHEIKPIKLKEFSEQWMRDYVEVNNKYSEVESKKMILRAHLLPHFGGTYLKDINNQSIEQYKSQKLKEKKSAKSINNHLTVLRKMLVTAEEWELLERLPKVKLLKVMPSKFDYLSKAECDRLISVADGVWKDMILFAIKTGLRFGEMIALKWSNIDFEKRTFIVNHSIVKDVPQDSTKSNRIRYIPIIDEVYEMLLKRKICTSGEYVFYEKDGKYLMREYARRRLIRMCKRAGLRRIGWHALRHTFASHLAERRITPNAIKDLLGHSDIKTTMRYAHLDSNALREAISVLEEPKPIVTKFVTKGEKEKNIILSFKEISA